MVALFVFKVKSTAHPFFHNYFYAIFVTNV
jgi:hypothetical protein